MNDVSRKTLERALARRRSEVEEQRRKLDALLSQVRWHRNAIHEGMKDVAALLETLEADLA